MTIGNAIALIAVSGTRQDDGRLLIDDETYDDFPGQIIVEGVSFDLAEAEEVDAQTRYYLGHYFRRD